MPVYDWSQTASSNATADPTIGWAEGQAPSTINDSARAMMAAQAKYRDDIAGAIVTAGTSTAYTVTSYSVFDTLAHLNGQVIAFSPHTTNGATVTLNVDGLGAKPLRSAPGTELLAGVLIQGTPYVAIYNNSDGAFYLRGFIGNASYGVPISAGMDYWGPTTPNSSFVFPYGQAISRTTYSTLFSLLGTIYGVGDGSTTFNLPDCRGRVIGCADNMGGTLAGRLTGLGMNANYVGLGGTGGLDSHVLTIAELPAHTHSNVLNDPGHTHSASPNSVMTTTVNQGIFGSTGPNGQTSLTIASNTTGITITNASVGSGGAHSILQPTILANKIIRVI